MFIDNLICPDTIEGERLAIEIEESRTARNQWLVVYAYDYKLFPQRFLDQFETVSLEDEPESVQGGKEAKPIFMDNKNNLLYLDKDNPIPLNPEEARLIDYMRTQKSFRLEQILRDHFKIKLQLPYKHSPDLKTILLGGSEKDTGSPKDVIITKSDRNKFDVLKAKINKKCESLGVGNLLIKHGTIKKVFQLSQNITIKEL